MNNQIGCLIIDINGNTLSQEDVEVIAHPLVGGVIFFARNYESFNQLRQLCKAIREVRETPLLIMVDQEGGRVQRFKQEFTELQPLSFLGKQYDLGPKTACHLAQQAGWIMASELLAAGIDMSLAPVLDLYKSNQSTIGTRALHANPQIVVELARAYIQGMAAAGMAATGKHFPGHGSVTLDSHLTKPVDDRPFAEIAQEDMVPFAQLIAQGSLSAIMAAHIIFPQVDIQPVGFSYHWLHTILRNQLGFAGTIFSDDLHMEGANISSHYADRVQAAREAGCDFILLCNHREGVIQALDHISVVSHSVHKEKWGKLQGQFSKH